MTEHLTPLVIPAEARTFLLELRENNNAAWFAAHKPTYELAVLEPLRRLVQALAPALRAIDPGFDLSPAGAVSRIRRDIRFSRDKSPFRSTLWLAFKRRSKEWTSRPAFFMEFGPEVFRHGMGFYSAGTRVMASLRALAQERPEAYADALESALCAGYALDGELYKRPRPPLDQPECVQELHRRRNVVLMRLPDPAEAFDNPQLAATLVTGFTAAAPLYRLWLEAADRAAQGGDELLDA